MSDDFTDEELIGYAVLHALTPVGGFDKKHVARLLRLAGDDETARCVSEHGPDVLYMGRFTIEALVEKIRKRQKEAAA